MKGDKNTNEITEPDFPKKSGSQEFRANVPKMDQNWVFGHNLKILSLLLTESDLK